MSDQPVTRRRHLITTYLWGAGFWPEAAIAGLFKFIAKRSNMRNRYTFAGVVLALALTLSLTAFAQSSSTNSQSQPGVVTQAPVQSPNSGASAPASPSTTPEPGQTGPAAQSGSPQSQTGSSVQSPAGSSAQSPATSQGATTGTAPSAAQGHAATQGPSVEDELQLTDAQKAKLQPIIQEEMSQIQAVRNDNSLTMDQKVAKVREIKQTEFPKIQAVLTPEQQKKLADMQERARQQGAGQAGSQNPSGAQGNSQPPK